MKTLQKVDKIVDRITYGVACGAAAALVFNMIIVIVNIVLRAFGSSVIGTEEYISVSEVVLIFLGLGYVQYQRGLVHVAFFIKKMPGRGTVITWAIDHWLAAFLVLLMVIETFKRIPVVTQTTTSLLIPYKPFYVIIAIGSIVFLMAILYEAVKSTIGIFNEEVRRDVEANLPA